MDLVLFIYSQVYRKTYLDERTDTDIKKQTRHTDTKMLVQTQRYRHIRKQNVCINKHRYTNMNTDTPAQIYIQPYMKTYIHTHKNKQTKNNNIQKHRPLPSFPAPSANATPLARRNRGGVNIHCLARCTPLTSIIFMHIRTYIRQL